ncbi:uncharacterized protein LOC144163266 [Haemaphysalis longicornis]
MECRRCRSMLSFRDLKECGRSRCEPGPAFYCGLRVPEVVAVATVRLCKYLAQTKSWLVTLDDDTDDMEAYAEGSVTGELEKGCRVLVTGRPRWTRAGFRLSLSEVRVLWDLSEETRHRRLQVEAYRHCLLGVKEEWTRSAVRLMVDTLHAYKERRKCDVTEAHVERALRDAVEMLRN